MPKIATPRVDQQSPNYPVFVHRQPTQAATTGPAPSRHRPSLWLEIKSQAQPQRRGISPNTMRASPKKRDPPASTAKTAVPAPSSASSASSASSTSSASSASARVANYAPTVSAVRVGQEAQAAPLASAASNAGCCRVTKKLIDAACTEFWRQKTAGQQVPIDEVDENADACGIRIEIARGMTPAMVKEIPRTWLAGLVVVLTDDGVLELLDAEGTEHRNAKGVVLSHLKAYANAQFRRENGLMASQEDLGVYRGENCRPDCVLSANYHPPNQPADHGRELPFVVVEVEVHHHSVSKLIEQAKLYLSEKHVLRVVGFKFFDSRVATDSTGYLSKAALAVVFERAGDAEPDSETTDIQVVEEVSFATSALDTDTLKQLSTVPSRTTPAGRVRYIPPSPLESIDIRISDMNASFPLPAHELVIDLSPRFGAPLTFDLGEIFQDAARGWKRDHFPELA